MSNAELIEEVEAIVGHRIEDAEEQGKWIVWDCNKSGKTMAKFTQRVKKETGQPAWCRDGLFGVLAVD